MRSNTSSSFASADINWPAPGNAEVGDSNSRSGVNTWLFYFTRTPTGTCPGGNAVRWQVHTADIVYFQAHSDTVPNRPWTLKIAVLPMYCASYLVIFAAHRKSQ